VAVNGIATEAQRKAHLEALHVELEGARLELARAQALQSDSSRAAVERRIAEIQQQIAFYEVKPGTPERRKKT
jgi:hypothetical protein